jgi:Na+/H+ antiporter NhaD/arsenite permease-like protein
MALGSGYGIDGSRYGNGVHLTQILEDMAVDGVFWQLLAYCAGVGGSMLIIGSAAGVVVMGLERITFGWYMKKITWIVFVGYLCGIIYYWCEKNVLEGLF